MPRYPNTCRTYSVDNGLDRVPELAAKVGLKVLLGVWIGPNRLKNALLIETAISLARDYPGVITAIVVGNELLLRKEMTASDLGNHPLGQGAREYSGDLRPMSGNSGCATEGSPTTSISSRYTCCHIGKTFRPAPKTRPVAVCGCHPETAGRCLSD